MVNLKTFVEKRQQDKVSDKRRQAIGDQYRISVPPTRLNQAVSTPRDHDSNGPPLKFSPSPFKQESNGGQETRRLDTDAESLDDTTIMSITAKSNGHPRALESQSPSKVVSSDTGRESSDVHDKSRYHHQTSAWMIDETSAPECVGEYLNESDDGESHDGYSALSSLVSHLQNEEFVNFKKHNLLDKSSIQTLGPRQDPAGKSGLATSVYTPANALRTAFSSSLRTHTPSREHARHVSSSSPQHSRRDVQESKGDTACCVTIMHQIAPPSVTTQADRETPAGFATLGQLPTRASRPSFQNTAAQARSACSTTKLEYVHKQVANENPSSSHIISVSDNDSSPSPELSDDDGAREVCESGFNKSTLKRRHHLDHSPDELNAMTFQQLREESFERFPPLSASVLSSELANTTLRAKLEQLSVIEDPGGQHDQQQDFFNSLSIGQYMESGDIIGKKLNEVLANLSRIRQKKREIAREFEGEIAKRDAVVNNKIAALKEEKIIMTRRTEQITASRTT